jgi:hypothetical protein
VPDLIQDHRQPCSSAGQLPLDHRLYLVHIILIHAFVQVEHALQHVVIIGAGIDRDGILAIDRRGKVAVGFRHSMRMTLECG